MTELERQLRAEMAEFCSDICAEASANALIGVLRMHLSGSDAHTCVKELEGYTVQAWYGPGEDCPTVVAIARGLGVLGEEGER